MNVYVELAELKGKIPKNVYKTILGQIKAGDFAGAIKGIEKLKQK